MKIRFLSLSNLGEKMCNAAKNKIILFIFIIIIFSSCKTKIIKIPSGNICDNKIGFEFAIYLKDNPNKNFSDIIKDIIQNKSMNLILVDDPSTDLSKPQIKIRVPADIDSYSPPSIDSLKYLSKGIEENEFNIISNSKYAVIFDFYTNKENLIATMKNAYEILYILAKENNGYIWDDITRECFSVDYWNVVRLEDMKNDNLNIKKHIAMHYYKSGQYYREITLGMQKFGLPDILINDLTANDSNSLGNLINLTCQKLFENGKIDNEGKLKLDINEIKNKDFKNNLISSLNKNAKKKIEIDIVNGQKEEGDPENRLIEIYFKEKLGKNKQIEQNRVISELFGSEDKVISIEHDKRLLDASNKAKEKLPEIKKVFQNGLKPGEYILVKLPFLKQDGGNEWMWVEISEWKENKIIGILQNDPLYINGLKAGSKVEGNVKDIFDYIHYFKDGTSEGNETSKIIKEMGK